MRDRDEVIAEIEHYQDVIRDSKTQIEDHRKGIARLKRAQVHARDSLVSLRSELNFVDRGIRGFGKSMPPTSKIDRNEKIAMANSLGLSVEQITEKMELDVGLVKGALNVYVTEMEYRNQMMRVVVNQYWTVS